MMWNKLLELLFLHTPPSDLEVRYVADIIKIGWFVCHCHKVCGLNYFNEFYQSTLELGKHKTWNVYVLGIFLHGTWFPVCRIMCPWTCMCVSEGIKQLSAVSVGELGVLMCWQCSVTLSSMFVPNMYQSVLYLYHTSSSIQYLFIILHFPENIVYSSHDILALWYRCCEMGHTKK